MKLCLSVESYKGVDGSSLSPTRCSQMVQVYNMLESKGIVPITYVYIQEEADRLKLFGKTKAKSAIRTFFPLLKKLDFVDYDGEFAANTCFTDLGTQFVLACRAIENVTDETPHKEKVLEHLESIKRNAQKQGLINMFNDPEWRNHNMWIVLKLLKEFSIIHWNEFLFSLHCIEIGNTLEKAISKIKYRKKEIDNIEFINEHGSPLPNTCYSYLRSFLEEAGLIYKVSALESGLTEEAKTFYSQINI